jgi:hypothetical protein
MAKRKKELPEGKVIGDKREHKINVDTKVVEAEVKKFLNKYNIDVEIEFFINKRLDDVLNEEHMLKNLKRHEKHHEVLFNDELYREILEVSRERILGGIEAELARPISDFEDEASYNINIEILNNINSDIQFTMFEGKSINKIDLIAFHYLIKNLEIRAKAFLEKHSIKNVRGYKMPIELFRYELIQVLGKYEQLSFFVLTLQSMIEQNLIKYNARTKIGSFYYNILMITTETIIEKVLKYLAFTAIKNMNPIYLRAIFATYTGLIHTNLFSFYGAKLSKVKAGYFKQLDSLFEENFAQDLNSYSSNTNQMVMDAMMLTYCMENKRFLKDGYEFLMDEYSNNFFDINYYDFLHTYDNKIPILDYMHYYGKFLKATNNSEEPLVNLFRINNLYTKKGNQSLKLFTQDIVNQQLSVRLKELIDDPESVDEICKILTDEIINKLNPNNFINDEFNRELIGLDTYYSQIQASIKNMQKLIC